VSRSRAGAAYTSRMAKAGNRDRIRITSAYIAGNTPWRSPERPGPVRAGGRPRSYAPRCIPAGSLAWPTGPALTPVARGSRCRMSGGYRKRVAVNRGNGASPGQPNRSVSPPARSRPGPALPQARKACWSGSRVDRGPRGRGRDATPWACARAGIPFHSRTIPGRAEQGGMEGTY
jgi:hypothetical protein